MSARIIFVVKCALFVILCGTFLDVNPGYYQFLRLCGTLGFLFIAYFSHRNNLLIRALLYFVTASFYIPLVNYGLSLRSQQIIYFLSGMVIVVDIVLQLIHNRIKKGFTGT